LGERLAQLSFDEYVAARLSGLSRERASGCLLARHEYRAGRMRRAWFSVLAFVAVLLASPRAWAKESSVGEPMRIQVRGASDAFFYKPRARGAKPVVMYLHGRGGNPAEDCRKWARVATQFGWVVCPSGATLTESGGRSWSNGAADAQRIVDATLEALRDKYKGRVTARGHVLVGFSEGAFVAMNVGLKDQRTWPRWLILGASDAYWGDVSEPLSKASRKVERVVLLTGQSDGVAPNTVRVGETLKKFKVPVQVKLVAGMGHEIPGDRMISTYRRSFVWLMASRGVSH
jgi:predicted esterase